MRNMMMCVLITAFAVIASAQEIPGGWLAEASQESREKVVYTAGPCSVTMLRSGSIVIHSKKDDVKEIMLVLKGQVRHFWILDGGEVVTSGPNLIGQCPLRRLPLPVEVKRLESPLFAKK